MRRRLIDGILAGGLAVSLLTSGCTSDSEPAGEDAGGVSSADAGVLDFDPDDIIVEQTVSFPDDPADEITFGVLSLKVDGEVMVLRLAVTPRLTSLSDSETVSMYDISRPNVFAPVLVDMANLKEYSVIADPPHYWTSDSVDTRALNGQPMQYWAVYAAPEDDIDTIDVRLTDYWPPFTDIPIER